MLATQQVSYTNFTPKKYVTAIGPDGAAGTTDGDYKYHTFTATKLAGVGFIVSDVGNAEGSSTVEYLVVGGGGGGSRATGAGGSGAGGFRTATGFSVSVQSYAITVGLGGAVAGSSGVRGTAGSDSVF